MIVKLKLVSPEVAEENPQPSQPSNLMLTTSLRV
jgi:hypothetical protein